MKPNTHRSKLRGILSTLFEILEIERPKHSPERFAKLVDETKQKVIEKPENFISGIVVNDNTKMLIDSLFDEFIESYG
jgi:hypothetical protein